MTNTALSSLKTHFGQVRDPRAQHSIDHRTNAHVSSYFTSGAFTVSQHLQQVLVIPSGFEPFGMSAALG